MSVKMSTKMSVKMSTKVSVKMSTKMSVKMSIKMTDKICVKMSVRIFEIMLPSMRNPSLIAVTTAFLLELAGPDV